MMSSTVNLHGIVGNGNIAVSATAKVKGTGGGADFNQILENATNRDSIQESNAGATRDNHQVEQEVPVEEVHETEQTDVQDSKDEPKGVTESQKPDNVDVSEEDLEEAMVVIQSAVLEIQELYCETLGISKEEFLQALDALGMTEMDLLAAGNATKLALYVEGQNELALLTNEDLYNTVQSLEEAMQQLSEDVLRDLNAVSPQEADELLNQALKAMNEAGTSDDAATIHIADETQVQVVSAQEGHQADEANTGESNAQGEGSNLFAGNQIVNNDFNQTIANVQNAEATFDMSQTQMIMDQIMEYMDIQLGAEDTTLQMQLHPEELGTLQVTISAKEGVMTAQFTAESEAVKVVLENQIVQLQDKFDQQNIKVEAIEISVATHGFEQNLQQDDNNGTYQEEDKKQRVRKIDINSLEAVDELPQEDRVVAEMMQLNGNSIDYMA